MAYKKFPWSILNGSSASSASGWTSFIEKNDIPVDEIMEEALEGITPWMATCATGRPDLVRWFGERLHAQGKIEELHEGLINCAMFGRKQALIELLMIRKDGKTILDPATRTRDRIDLPTVIAYMDWPENMIQEMTEARPELEPLLGNARKTVKPVKPGHAVAEQIRHLITGNPQLWEGGYILNWSNRLKIHMLSSLPENARNTQPNQGNTQAIENGNGLNAAKSRLR